VAGAERAALACDPAQLDRFRDAFPMAMDAVGPHVDDLRDHRTPSVRVAAWRCRLFVCEGLVTLGAGCHPALAMTDRRWAFDRFQYLLATATRRRRALPADALAARISQLLSAAAGLRFADVLRGSRLADVPRLGRMSATVEVGRRLGRRLLGAARA
jgi:hypothetical protein